MIIIVITLLPVFYKLTGVYICTKGTIFFNQTLPHACGLTQKHSSQALKNSRKVNTMLLVSLVTCAARCC